MNEFELPKTKEEKMVTESRTPLSLKELVKEIFTFLTHTDLINIIVFCIFIPHFLFFDFILHYLQLNCNTFFTLFSNSFPQFSHKM